MIEARPLIPTRDGATETFICHPERGGPFPVVLFYMDAPAIREELRDMARRIAACGYYVMLPNLYYREGVLELPPMTGPDGDAVRARMFELMASLDVPKVMRDTESLLAHADADPAARAGSVGTVGYCMSGQYAVNAATHFPGRVTAAASFYGVSLVTEREDSPHLAGDKTKAELYFGCAQTDRWAPPEMVAALAAAMAKASTQAEVEVYPGTEHGFAFPQRAVYDPRAADRHWERLLALFRRRL
ncbi:MAG: dienelactone hydrolase family protein [Alphaproteobacteria bacterium]|jgi:carboxymethylenebutenolidase|nr:dienelactone hydrolase family protein [Alphaproteobacteria bacterium]